MLRNISHIVFSFLMLIATVGVTFNEHYCGNSMKEAFSSGMHDHHCCNKESCGHCKSHIVTYKLTADYLASSTSSLTQNIPSFELESHITRLFTLNFFNAKNFPGRNAHYNPLLHAPPPFQEITQSFLC